MKGYEDKMSSQFRMCKERIAAESVFVRMTTGSLLLNRGYVLNALKNIENEYKYNQHNQNESKRR